jgi:hypothetical protein
MVLLISDGGASPGQDDGNYHYRQHRRTNVLVNRLGYPRGEGNTFEEQRGPHLYILGKVKQIHFEENAIFYTLTREDNGQDVRGDAGE